MFSLILKLFLISIIATSLMTLFSYALSRLTGQQFREPQLLNLLITSSSTISFTPEIGSRVGWLIHYLIGVFFSITFYFFYKAKWLELEIFHTLLYGLGFGFIGIIGWKIMFLKVNLQENIPYRKFYFQLVLAHLIFTICLTINFIFFEI